MRRAARAPSDEPGPTLLAGPPALRRQHSRLGQRHGTYASDLPPAPAHYADFAGFLRRLGATVGDRAGAWEIWNEPNLAWFWRNPDPVAYAKLLKAAAPALRAADPGALIVSAGPSLNRESGEGDRYRRSMERVGSPGTVGAVVPEPARAVAVAPGRSPRRSCCTCPCRRWSRGSF